MGAGSRSLSGFERLKVMHDMMAEDAQTPFLFSYDMVSRTGLTTKDFIAPMSFDFRNSRTFKMGPVYKGLIGLTTDV